MDNEPKEAAAARSDWSTILAHLLSPVPLIAMIMLIGVLVLLLMAIMGWDRGHVLMTMAQPDFARGLITYLFTVVTIGTAIVLIISGLTGGRKEDFDRGKEILGLLLGVFGTMVGFYFGSAVSHAQTKLTLTTPLLSASEVQSGQLLSVTDFVQGGTSPYRLAITLGDTPPTNYNQAPRGDGWIIGTVTAPEVQEQTPVTLWIAIQDAAGDVVTAKAMFVDKPAAAQK
jgi:hypothetical protein